MSELGPTLTSSDRTATDELRRLLDERGVEYVLDDEYAEEYPPEQRVTWSSDIAGEDMTVTARDYCININDDGSADYCLDLEFHEVFTPEQAIAATLGAGTCKPREVRSRFSKTQECVTYHCECGHELGGYMTAELPFPHIYNEDELPNFCPNCGRRVVSE